VNELGKRPVRGANSGPNALALGYQLCRGLVSVWPRMPSATRTEDSQGSQYAQPLPRHLDEPRARG